MRRDVVKLPFAVMVSALLILTLSWSVQITAAEGTGKSTPSVSPAHLNLLRLARQGKLGSAAPTVYKVQGASIEAIAGAKKAADRKVKSQSDSAASGETRSVFRAPDEASRQAMAASLARHLMNSGVSADGRDLPLLRALNELNAAGSVSLASTRLQSATEEGFTPVHESEPNDTWTAAQAITFGNAVEADGTPDVDVDVYSFEGQAGEYIRLEASPTGDQGWVTMLLFDPDSLEIYGGLYALERSAVMDSRIMPPIWGGGNMIGKNLEKSGVYHVMVFTHPGNIVYYRTDALKADVEEDSSSPVGYRLTLASLPVRPVSGVLMDDLGQTVAGADISFWSSDYYNGSRIVSGRDGSFALSLPEGEYWVSVQSPAGSRYPSDQISQSLTVASGGAKVDLTLKSGVIFSGRVVEDRGPAVAWAGFSLSDEKNYQYRWASADSNGEFSLAVFPGTFNLYIYPGWQYPNQPVTQGVQVQADMRYDITIDTGKRVSGRVLGPDGAVLGQAEIVFQGVSDTRYAYADDNGQYMVALPAGDYSVTVIPAERSNVPPQALGGISMQSGDLALDLQLKAGAVLTGLVVDDRGNAVPDAQINLWYDYWSVYNADTTLIKREDPSGYYSYNYQVYNRTVYTGEDGRWQAAVVPGAWTTEVVAPWNYPAQAVKAGSYTLAVNDRVETPRAELYYGVTFSGRVVLADGSPLAYEGFYMYTGGDIYYIYDRDGNIVKPENPEPFYSYWVYTEYDGSFNVQVMPAASYTLQFSGRADKDGYPGQTVENVDLSIDRQMTFNLQSGYLVSGRVTTSDGAGLEGSYLNFIGQDINSTGAQAWTNYDGYWAVRVLPGDYSLAVEPVAGYFPDSSLYNLPVKSDLKFDLVFKPGVWVGGRVIDRNGKPVAGAMVHAMQTVSSDSDTLFHILPVSYVMEKISLQGEEDGTASDGTGKADLIMPIFRADPYFAWTDENGYWEMSVKPGIYDLYVSPGWEYASLYKPGMDLSADTKLELVVDLSEIRISGRVEDENGHPADSVLVSAYDPATGGNVSTWTDSDGRYEFMLPAGNYEVVLDGAKNSGLQVVQDVNIESDRSLNFRMGQGLLDGDDPGQPTLPKAFALSQNYPNPFNPSTTIQYDLPEAGHVQIRVFNIRGNVVATLVNGEEEAGVHVVQWDGREESGRTVSSGVYFYRMETASFSRIRKMVLLK